MENKVLYLLRGIPGCGKSTVAEAIIGNVGVHLEADMYHYDVEGNYNWKPENMGKAHEWCQLGCESAMKQEMSKIVISNTSTTEKELKPYYDLAEKYGYMVFSLIVENRHRGVNVHSVPAETLERMKNRFSIKL